MPVIFSTPGLIDLRALQFMGVSAKLHDNPIGKFGTGLKYAIAVLLREDNHVTMWRGLEEYTFHAREEDFRGKLIKFIYMNDTPLGITTDLGQNWDMWQALRELESNTRDEKGQSANLLDWRPDSEKTTLVISGSFQDTYDHIDEIFISELDKPIYEDNTMSIHRSKGGDDNQWMYYRGVRTQRLEKPTHFRYNIKKKMDLTEDRTFQYTWVPVATLTHGIINCGMDVIWDKVLYAGEKDFESGLDYNRLSEYPEAFMTYVRAQSAGANASARMAIRIAMKEAEFEEIEMDKHELLLVRRATDFIATMGEKKIREMDVQMADLGPQMLGTIRGDTIYLSKRVFEQGYKQVISTMFEEYIHWDRGYADGTYQMQTFLFDLIIGLQAKLTGEIV